MFNYTNEDGVNIPKIITHCFIALFVVIVLSNSFGTIGAGQRGVLTQLGAVMGVKEPGLYVKVPFIQAVQKMDIQTRTVSYEREDPLYAASKDLQDVQIAIVTNYHIDPTKVAEIYTQYRSVDNYEAAVIRPIVRDTGKSVASNYTAEELVTKRADYNDKVIKALTEILQPKNVIVERVNITNFQFSKSFTEAIEAKVTAVQNAEAAKNKLEQVKAEAQQTVEKAKAEAEAIRIQAQAINSQGGADYVELQKIQKWNGAGCTQYCGLEASTGLLITGK